MKNVEVMMVKCEELEGKVVKSIKMVEMKEDVMDYVELGSSEKVKEEIKKKLREEKVFGGYDVEDLWYKWDDFMKEWRRERSKLVKKMKEENKVEE